jgi:hypothetical protein
MFNYDMAWACHNWMISDAIRCYPMLLDAIRIVTVDDGHSYKSREIDRHTHSHTQTGTVIDTDRQTDTDMNRHTDRHSHTDRHTKRHSYRHRCSATMQSDEPLSVSLS